MFHPHYKNKKESRSVFAKTIDGIIYIVAVISPLMALPQVYIVYATQNVSGISTTTWMAYVFTSVIWLLYGIVHKEKVIIVNSSLGGILSFLIFFGTLIYR